MNVFVKLGGAEEEEGEEGGEEEMEGGRGRKKRTYRYTRYGL